MGLGGRAIATGAQLLGNHRASGCPHAAPVWDVWLDGAFYFGTDRNSRKARNAAANPAMTLHLESGEEAVIAEGTATEIDDAAQIALTNEVYKAKYAMRLTDAPDEMVIFALRPKAVLAWREKDFNQSATRWAFAT